MLTVDIRVNSTLLSYIKVVNRGHTPDGSNNYIYDYTLHNTESGTVQCGTISHDRSNGALSLVEIMLSDFRSKMENGGRYESEE